MTDRPHGRLLARNTGLNLLGQGIPLLVAIVATPFIVRGLGSERYGIFSMALVVLGYFGLFDLGLGRATTRFVATALSSNERSDVPAIAWSAITVQAGLGMVAAGLLVVIAPIAVTRILNIQPSFVPEARRTLYVLAFSIPAVLIAGSLRGVLEAAQRFDLVNAVAAPLSAANFLLPLGGVLLRWDLPAIVATLLISRVAGAALFYASCLRVFPDLKRAPRFRVATARELLGFGGWVTVSSIISPILVYLDRIMVGVLFTMTAVAYYSAPYEMVTRVLIIPISLVSTLFPAFSRIHGEEEIGRLHQLVGNSVKYLLGALAPAVVILLAFPRDILAWWLGADFATNSSGALQILSVGVLANSIALVPFALIQGSGRPDVTAKLHLVEVPIQFGVAWGFVNAWGIAGAALAWTTRTTLDAVLLFVAAFRLSVSSSRSLVEMKVPQFGGLLVLLGSGAVASRVLIHEVATRLLVVVTFLVLAGMYAWRRLLSNAERSQIKALLPTTR